MAEGRAAWEGQGKAGQGHCLRNHYALGTGQDENERECVAAARRVFQLSLTASSLALDLQRLELACAFLLTDRLWAVAMADLAQLADPLRPLQPPPRQPQPNSIGPHSHGRSAGAGWVEKLEPFWQLFVTYVVEATAGTEHNLAWWMAAVRAGNAYLPDLVNPLQWAQPMNAKMLVGAAAQYVQEPTPTPGCLVLVGAAAGGGRLGGAAGHGRPHAQEVPLQVVSSLMQALVASGEARCLRLHQQLGAACNVTSQGNGVTAAEQVSPKQAGAASGGSSGGALGASGGAAAGATGAGAGSGSRAVAPPSDAANASSPAAASAAEPAQGASVLSQAPKQQQQQQP
ncbi:hypothetical protein V8C86DRAFT_3089815 [Haematococcus lacustris]